MSEFWAPLAKDDIRAGQSIENGDGLASIADVLSHDADATRLGPRRIHMQTHFGQLAAYDPAAAVARGHQPTRDFIDNQFAEPES